MSESHSPIHQLRNALSSGELTSVSLATQALSRANKNAGRNVYLAQNVNKVLHEAEQLPTRFTASPKPLLYGMPISLKDCFDLADFSTSCGTHFYAERNGIAVADSAVAARLRTQGALIVGKTHLHSLAYGITGENPDYGDCVQPRNSDWLTGGSSSGAAASVQEGSAVAAIGTDTGGSVRVPAALCGLAGYRASLDLAHSLGLWRGGMHLSQSFDTLGWLFCDLRDGPLLAEGLFGISFPPCAKTQVRIANVGQDFLHDCESPVIDGYERWKRRLQECDAEIVPIDVDFWGEATDIFAPIQAHEAAAIHSGATEGDFSQFESSIAERLMWGASLSRTTIEGLRKRCAMFCGRMADLLRQYDFLVVPCAPMNRLAAGADHGRTRRAILRYTTPMSIAGVPVVTLPAGNGSGVQLVAARGEDARLLTYAAQLGRRFEADLGEEGRSAHGGTSYGF